MSFATTSTLRTFLLAAGYTEGTLLGTYTQAEEGRDVQTYETAAWNSVYALNAGQTVPVTLRLRERYVQQNCLKFGYSLAAVELEHNCRALFCGVPIPGCVEAPHVPTPAVRHFDQWYTDFPAFALRPGVVLTQAGEELLALAREAVAEAKQAAAEYDAARARRVLATT